MRAFTTLVAALLMTFGGVAFAEQAEATRPVPGFNYTDQCKNIPGLQPSYQMVGTGPYRFKGNPRAHLCVRRAFAK